MLTHPPSPSSLSTTVPEAISQAVLSRYVRTYVTVAQCPLRTYVRAYVRTYVVHKKPRHVFQVFQLRQVAYVPVTYVRTYVVNYHTYVRTYLCTYTYVHTWLRMFDACTLRWRH